MNTAARPRLHAVHSEVVQLIEGGATREIPGVWRRILPEGGAADEGSQGFEGTSTFVVLLSKLPTLPGAEAEFLRNGERWQITHAEPQDAWTWILHLSRPDHDRHIPTRRG